MQHTAPKQTKLLGATVRGLGIVTAVSSTVFSCYAMIEDEAGVRHHRFLSDLSKDDVILPTEPQPFATRTERIGYGVWDEVHALATEPVAFEVAA